MQKIVTGIIHGSTIELDESPGLADGQRVTLELCPGVANKEWEKAVRQISGSMADDVEFETTMKQIEEDRKNETRPPVQP